MLEKVMEILRANRLAALATVGPDGWPHCTMIGFAHDGVRIYFAIAPNSRKFTDIERDDRVSLAIGRDVIDPSSGARRCCFKDARRVEGRATSARKE